MAKKILKIIGFIAAIAAVVAGIYFAVKLIKEKKAAEAYDEENYVSCSCCEAQ